MSLVLTRPLAHPFCAASVSAPGQHTTTYTAQATQRSHRQPSRLRTILRSMWRASCLTPCAATQVSTGQKQQSAELLTSHGRRDRMGYKGPARRAVTCTSLQRSLTDSVWSILCVMPCCNPSNPLCVCRCADGSRKQAGVVVAFGSWGIGCCRPGAAAAPRVSVSQAAAAVEGPVHCQHQGKGPLRNKRPQQPAQPFCPTRRTHHSYNQQQRSHSQPG